MEFKKIKLFLQYLPGIIIILYVLILITLQLSKMH